MRSCVHFLLLAPLLLATYNIAAAEILEDFSELQWKHRIILVNPDSDLKDWSNQLLRADSEIVDRDILWFAFDGESVKTNSTHSMSDQLTGRVLERYFNNRSNKLVLIGKDGGVKDVSTELNLQALFALIDGMPMRRAEVKERSN